ncbi:MAG: hypothetical protein HY903_21605 [Deltaproteobacteria bacterium]|nr:hypothetical protein [Deltaproteobacteria bacterium]
MPGSKTSNPFLKMSHVDLAYAVQRLVRDGRTTASRVRALGAERQAEIALLEARVAALKAAVDVEAPAPAKRKYSRRAKVARTAVVAKGKRPVGRPKGSKNKVKAKTKAKPAKAARIAKRPAKVSAKAAAARRIQGRYMGLRRHLSANLQVEATKIAQAQGVGAALKFVEGHAASNAA